MHTLYLAMHDTIVLLKPGDDWQGFNYRACTMQLDINHSYLLSCVNTQSHKAAAADIVIVVVVASPICAGTHGLSMCHHLQLP